MDTSIKINLRPCVLTKYGDESKYKALFHCWIHYSNVIPPSNLRGGHNGGQVSDVYGLVELEDGSVEIVSPKSIRFLDSPFNDYAWGLSVNKYNDIVFRKDEE